MQKTIKAILKESAETKLRTAETLAPAIEEAARAIITSYKKGGKLIIFGNGGSAADAQHIATELLHQFESKRAALPALILHGNTSALTSIGNDWGFKESFSRQIDAFAKPEDVVIAISTSGNSENILLAVKASRRIGCFTIGFTNSDGGRLNNECDLLLKVPATNTARVQECHITIGHIICKLVETELFPEAGTKVAP